MKIIVYKYKIMIEILKNINFTNIFIYLSLFFIISYVWFKISDIESKISLLEQKIKKESCNLDANANKCNIPLKNQPFKNFEMDNIIMNDVFNYCNNNPIELPVAEHVKIEEQEQELQEQEIENKKEVFDLKKEEIPDNNSSVGGITKKKLSKLNLDGLKQKCTELNLQTEGTKNELIERILNSD